jgi:predicted RNA-binding Zn ribbon-like protein
MSVTCSTGDVPGPTLAHACITGQNGDVALAFDYIGGRLVLDFVGTVANRGADDVERLHSWADVESWVRGSSLRIDDMSGDDDVDRVHDLRESLYSLITAAVDGVRPPEHDRELVNAAAAGPGPKPELTEAGEVRWTGGLDAVLAALARDALDLVGSSDIGEVRRCADGRCTRLFIDRSRGARRRWCGMKGCGDRAKAASYRRRRRAARA